MVADIGKSVTSSIDRALVPGALGAALTSNLRFEFA